MSYILDALKKLERERHLGGLPTLDTDHSLPVETRRWISFLLGIASVIVAAVLLIAWLRPGILAEIRQGVASAPSAPEREAAPEAPKALELDGTESAHSPHGVISDKPPPAASKNTITEKKIPIETRPPAKSRDNRDLPTNARAALIPPPKVAPKTTKAAKELTPKRLLDKAEAKSRIEPRISSPPKRAILTRAPDPTPRDIQATLPPEQITPDEIDKSSASYTPPPSLQQLPVELRSSVPEMRISLLAYTKNAADRMVYINGAKYQEGQMVEGKVKVEAIIPEGAILSIQGQRFLLGR